jgi:RNA recognition motif-containing protein
MKIFVGNISTDVKEEELEKLFSKHGEVESVEIVFDKLTGESRKFGFIRMPNESEANNAVKSLDGKNLKGKTLRVNHARRSIQGREDGNRRSGPPKFKDE